LTAAASAVPDPDSQQQQRRTEQCDDRHAGSCARRRLATGNGRAEGPERATPRPAGESEKGDQVGRNADQLGSQRGELLRRSLAALPAAEREVLQACALEDTSYEEFSRRCGILPATAKSRAFPGRQRLRRILAEA
jgi:DNA-directed RNA polymerase specialized sigma24 family protein